MGSLGSQVPEPTGIDGGDEGESTETNSSGQGGETGGGEQGIEVSNHASKLLSDNGITDLSGITATGKGGTQITKKDAENYLESLK
jgi:hypothetical protein